MATKPTLPEQMVQGRQISLAKFKEDLALHAISNPSERPGAYFAFDLINDYLDDIVEGRKPFSKIIGTPNGGKTAGTMKAMIKASTGGIMVTKPDCDCTTFVEMALHDWELSGCEDDWWGSYPCNDETYTHAVDIHIDLLPDPREPEQLRRTLSVYPVFWEGKHGKIDTEFVIHRQILDMEGD